MRTPHYIPAKILNAMSNLRYSHPTEVIHLLDLGDWNFIRVVGDYDGGGYEWVIERAKPTPFTGRPAIEFSEKGYGQSEVALRDGLIAYFGLPDKE